MGADAVTFPTRKGWSQATLDRLGVERGDCGRWRIPTAGGVLRYSDDGRAGKKMLADRGATRELWPAPEDQPGETVAVVEGEPDAISFAELFPDMPVVALPGTGKAGDDWPQRIAAGRLEVFAFMDADSVGRTRMRRLAEQVTALDGLAVPYVIDLAPEQDDGFDVGDLLMEAGAERAREVVARLMFGAEPYAAEPMAGDGRVSHHPTPYRERDSGTPLFMTRPVDLSQLRPVRFVWRPWLIHGRLNLFVGEESSGKSTLQGWLATNITRGALPGERDGAPGDVLWVGADEDDWYEIVTPRLYAMGADLARVREFVPAHDDAAIFNVVDHIAELDRELRAHPFALVVFEQIMDVLPAVKNSNDPLEIRRALRPLRRMLAAREVTGLGTLHVNKAQADQLRQRMQGSMQFGALSRSTILVDRHPTEAGRRIAVLGKANYVAEPVAMSFRIDSHPFDLNGREFDVGRVADVQDDDASLDDVLRQGRGERERQRDAKREAVVDALTDEPQSVRDVASAAGVAKSTTDRILKELAADDLAEQTDNGWVSHVPPSKDGTGTGHGTEQGELIERPGGFALPDDWTPAADLEHDDDREDWRQR